MWGQLNTVPANGTVIAAATSSPDSGGVFVVAGGAPIYTTTCMPFCSEPTTEVDGNAIADAGQSSLFRLNAVPANGTFLKGVQTGNIFVVAGGATPAVSNCAALGYPGCDMSVTAEDQAVISSPANAIDHLNLSPANGTIVWASTSSSMGGGFRLTIVMSDSVPRTVVCLRGYLVWRGGSRRRGDVHDLRLEVGSLAGLFRK